MSAILPVSLGAQIPTRPFKASMEITGEFRENGSCQVFADGVAVFHPADSAQTTYIRGATLNIAPIGFESHEIWCGPQTSEDPAPPTDSTGRMFVVMLYAPTGTLTKPRSYQVRPGLPTRERAPYRAGAALFGMSPQMINDTMPIAMGLIYMAGNRGKVVITRVSPARIVGAFAIHARLGLTM
ncbi:MAG: hypothetical protein ABI229_05885 [Gemmatimonadaceae bacterium]